MVKPNVWLHGYGILHLRKLSYNTEPLTVDGLVSEIVLTTVRRLVVPSVSSLPLQRSM